MKVEIKRTDEEYGMTYWMVRVDDQNVSVFTTFRKAWNCAKKFASDPKTIILDPIDA